MHEAKRAWALRQHQVIISKSISKGLELVSFLCSVHMDQSAMTQDVMCQSSFLLEHAVNTQQNLPTRVLKSWKGGRRPRMVLYLQKNVCPNSSKACAAIKYGGTFWATDGRLGSTDWCVRAGYHPRTQNDIADYRTLQISIPMH